MAGLISCREFPLRHVRNRNFLPARFARRVNLLNLTCLKDFANSAVCSRARRTRPPAERTETLEHRSFSPFARRVRAPAAVYISTGGGGLFYRNSDSQKIPPLGTALWAEKSDSQKVPPLVTDTSASADTSATAARFVLRGHFLKDSAFATRSKSQIPPGALRAPA